MLQFSYLLFITCGDRIFGKFEMQVPLNKVGMLKLALTLCCVCIFISLPTFIQHSSSIPLIYDIFSEPSRQQLIIGTTETIQEDVGIVQNSGIQNTTSQGNDLNGGRFLTFYKKPDYSQSTVDGRSSERCIVMNLQVILGGLRSIKL